MKVTPVSSPAAVTQAPAADNRAKAIAAFNNTGKATEPAKAPTAPTTGQAQETAVQNPNQVSVEELSAIKAPSAPAEAAETIDNTATMEAQADQPAAEIPVEKKPETKASQEWAKLARQERQLRARAQEQEAKFKQREAAITARESEAKATSEINQKGFISIEELKRDLLGATEKAGLSYDEVAQQMMNTSKIDPRIQSTIDNLKAEIADLRKGSTEANERMTRQQTDAYNAAVKQIELDTRSLVNADPNFETIKQTGSVRDVVELITKTYEKDGVLMTVEEAAQEVENYLVDEAMKLTRIEKIKRRLQPQATAGQKTSAPADTKGQTQAPMKTLTNAASSTRKLSARERAMLAFKNELK